MTATDPEIRNLIISTMKNEGPFVLEWVAYHRVIGFDSFLIYTNDCADGTDRLLERLDALGVVHHRHNEVLRRGPHKSALKHARADAVYDAAGRVLVSDVDEFLNIGVGAGHLGDLLAHYPDADAIPVTWRMFSNNGHVGLLDGVLEPLTECEPSGDGPGEKRFVKTLFRRPATLDKLGLHAPHYTDEAAVRWRSTFADAEPGRDPRRPSRALGYEIAQMNHYAVRSIDCYLLKRDRGRANHVRQTLSSEYWLRWCRGGATDRSILRHMPAVKAEIARLMADPEVARLDMQARAQHRARLAELRDDPDYAALRAELLQLGGVAPQTTVTE